jgi:hypothetical protein
MEKGDRQADIQWRDRDDSCAAQASRRTLCSWNVTVDRAIDRGIVGKIEVVVKLHRSSNLFRDVLRSSSFPPSQRSAIFMVDFQDKVHPPVNR